MGDKSDEEKIELPPAFRYGSINDIIDIYPMYDMDEDIKCDYQDPEHARVSTRYCCNSPFCGEFTKGTFIFICVLVFLLVVCIILPFELLFYKAY